MKQTFLTVFTTPHISWEIEDLPFNLRTFREHCYADDLFDKRAIEAGTKGALHHKYGIDPSKGAIVAVRPDGYVGAVVSLNQDGFEALNTYFKGFLLSTKQ